MWSIGCIFAELFCRRPLFPGKSYISQLNAICDIIGTPTADDMHFVVDSAANFLRSLPEKPRRPWRDLPGLESASTDAIDLLDKLLAFDPNKRIGAEDALKHPFLKSYAGLKPISAPEPVDPESLDCNKLTIPELRAKVMTHVRLFRGDTYDYPQAAALASPLRGGAGGGGVGGGIPVGAGAATAGESANRSSLGHHSFGNGVRPSPVLEESDG
jgi:mitogen-activated protein kinase 1/3